MYNSINVYKSIYIYKLKTYLDKQTMFKLPTRVFFFATIGNTDFSVLPNVSGCRGLPQRQSLHNCYNFTISSNSLV